MSEPAQELRAAAQRLRTLAEAATVEIDKNPYWGAATDGPETYDQLYAEGMRGGMGGPGGDLGATFTPGVAIALATVLEREAHQEEYRLAEFGHRTIYDDVIALARLVLEAK